MELDTAVWNILFPSDGEVKIASEDPDLFVMVMTEFNKFETEVCHVCCKLTINGLPLTSLFI